MEKQIKEIVSSLKKGLHEEILSRKISSIQLNESSLRILAEKVSTKQITRAAAILSYIDCFVCVDEAKAAPEKRSDAVCRDCTRPYTMCSACSVLP